MKTTGNIVLFFRKREIHNFLNGDNIFTDIEGKAIAFYILTD